MKSNWQTKTLGEVCEVFDDGDWIEKKDQSSEGIRLIQTGNVGNGIFKNREGKSRFISEKTFKRLRCTEIVPSDCLISRLPDPVGRSCIIPETGEKMITAVDCTIVRFKNEEVLPWWFIYYSLSNEYQSQINKQLRGTTRQRISRSNLGVIEIPLPEPSEQRRIVAILDDVFERTAKAKANAEKNLANAREVFESYAASVFENPGTWKEVSLGEVCSLFQGIAINVKTKHLLVEKSDLPLLRIKDLKNNTVEQFVDPKKCPKNAFINESDLIYTRTGQIGLVFTGKRGALHNNSFKIEPTSVLTKQYLFWWLQNPIFKSKIISLASRAAQPDITHVLFKQQLIELPPLSEQKAIVKQLEAFDDETKQLEAVYRQKLSSLEELKKSVLRSAFSGQL